MRDGSADAQISALENEKAEAEAEARSLAAELEAVQSEPSSAAPVGSSHKNALGLHLYVMEARRWPTSWRAS